MAGASSGIGEEIAISLAKNGATVICLARRKDKLDEVVEKILAAGGKAECFKCDLREAAEVEKVVAEIVDKHSKIDLWVNGVGVNNAMGITWEIDYSEWCDEVDTNLKSCYIGTKCAINQMKTQKFGRIINMSGGGVVKPEVYNSAYACSKTAIVRFTECVSLELQAENIPIKIFAFGPGLVRTQRTIDLIRKPETKKFMPAIIDKIENDEATPIHKPAEFIMFIASGAVDELQGCLLSTYMNKEDLVNNMSKIKEQNLYKLCVRA